MIRALILRWQLERAIKRQSVIRKARAEAAKRGVHTEWKRRAAGARTMFP